MDSKNAAILVQVELFGTLSSDLHELKELTLTAGIQMADVMIVARKLLDAEFYVGSGKVDELQTIIAHHGADCVIFNHDLSPTQERNLEKRLHVQVMSRTALILKIFAQRARTHEGKLQVELAQLQYESTRLVKGWTHLERQRGGIGVRGGPGETQLEIDKRLIRQRIKAIKQDLDKVKRQRKLGRASRKKSGTPLVALVGYTNAGKSTLFNRLTHSDVYAANQLFATLDPALRQFELPHFGEIIFADTVGFIRNLPHSLIDAFQATLEETVSADLILHVIDASHPEHDLQKQEVMNVLTEIGATGQPVLEVFNKIDLCESVLPGIDFDEAGLPKRIRVSALTGAGMNDLFEAVLQHLAKSIFAGEIILPPDAGRVRSTLYAWQAVVHESIDQEGNIHLKIRVARTSLNHLLQGCKDGVKLLDVQ